MSDPPARSKLSVGIDLGTSAVKVVALDDRGAPLGEGVAGFATQSANPQQAEQEPADWLRAATIAMRALNESLTRTHGPRWSADVSAIGLTGQLPTLVCVSADGPVAPAITWKDGRADGWAASLVDTGRRASMYAVTGMPIDGRYLAPMLRFHFADRLENVRCVLSAKDHLLAALTGAEFTEPSTAAGYGIYHLREQRFDDALRSFWQVPRALLPEIRPTNSFAGPLTAAGATLLGLPAGIAVSTGAADSVCSAFAMAGLDEGVVSISFGSSAVVIGACAEPRLDPAARYLVTPHVAAGWYGREMDLLATGTGYRWLSDLFGWTGPEIDDEAARSVPGAYGLVFPPYLAGGEQGALWNPRLVGALMGLNLRHSRADIARAFLEGVFYEIKRCVEVLAETGPVERVAVSGNLVASRASVQLLADILSRPVCITPHRSPAAVGAALLARTMSGTAEALHERTPAPPAASPRAAGIGQVTPPHPGAARTYAALYRQYLFRAAACTS